MTFTNMFHLFEAELNGEKVWFVREDHNVIGMMFKNKESAEAYFAGDKNEKDVFGVAVSSEVMVKGTAVGYIKNINQIA